MVSFYPAFRSIYNSSYNDAGLPPFGGALALAAGQNFDGSTYLEHSGPLTGVEDGKSMTFVMTFKRGQTGVLETLWGSTNNREIVSIRGADDKVDFRIRTSGGTNIFRRYSLPVDKTSVWYTLMVSFDLTDSNRDHMYINNVDAQDTDVAFANLDASFAEDNHYVGDNYVQSSPFTGDIARIWIKYNTYTDFSNVANCLKFLDDNLELVDLPYGGFVEGIGTPDVFLNGNDLTINRGTGGTPFAVGAGSLSSSSTNPNDDLLLDLTQFSTLEGWWDADDPSEYVDVSGQIIAINDKSGNTNALGQGTSSAQPTLVSGRLNDRDGFYFDSSNSQFLATTSAKTLFSTPAAETAYSRCVFSVAETTDDQTGSGCVFFFGNSGTATQRCGQLIDADGDVFVRYSDTASVSDANVNTYALADQPLLIEGQISGTTAAASPPPAAVSNVSNYLGGIFYNDDAAAIDHPTLNTIALGRQNDSSPNGYFDGYWYETIALSEIPNDLDRRLILQYFKDKWAIPVATVVQPLLGTGQSNMEGRAPTASTNTPLRGTSIEANSTTINYIEDPVSGAIDGSCWPNLCKKYYASGSRIAAVIETAVSSSALVAAADIGSGNWSSTGALRGASITEHDAVIADLATRGVRNLPTVVIYALGETDAQAIDSATITQAQHESELEVLFAYFRTQLGNDTVIIISEIGFDYAQPGPDGVGTTGFVEVRQVQNQIVSNQLNTHMGWTKAKDERELNGITSGLHYSTAGYDDMGQSIGFTIFNKVG